MTTRRWPPSLAAAALSLLTLLACTGGAPPPNPGAGLADLPGSISARVTQGGPNPAAQSFNVRNTGACDMPFTLAVVGGSWLSASAAASTATKNGGTVPVTIGFNVVTPQLLPGTYTATIEVSGTCATNGEPAEGSPRAVAVNLTVTALNAILGVTEADGGTETGIDVDVTLLQDKWQSIGASGSPLIGDQAFSVGHGFWTGNRLGVMSYVDEPGALFDPYSGLWTSIPAPFGNGSALAASDWVNGSLVAVQYPNVKQLDTSAATLAWQSGAAAPTFFNDLSSQYKTAVVGSRLLFFKTPTSGTTNALGIAYYDPAGNQGSGAWDGPHALDTQGLCEPPQQGGLSGQVTIGVTGKYLLLTRVVGLVQSLQTCLCDLTALTCKATSAAGFTTTFLTQTNHLWTGDRFIVFTNDPGGGALYSPYSDSWTALPTEPTPRVIPGTAVWTGDRAIFYDNTRTRVLVLSDPPVWSSASTVNAPPFQSGTGVAVWTGTEMVRWGSDADATPQQTAFQVPAYIYY